MKNIPQVHKLSRASQLSLVAVVILFGAVLFTVNSAMQTEKSASNASGSANMLINPSFESGGGPWWLNISSYGGAGQYTVTSSQHEDGSYAAQVNITSAISNSSNWWYVQLLQNNLPLQSGQSYTVTYWAKASSTRTINAGVQNGVSPYQIFAETSPVVTTSWQQFSYTFTPNATLSNNQLVFNLASATGTVWIDNVSLSQSNAAPQATPVPTVQQLPTVVPTEHPTEAPMPTTAPTVFIPPTTVPMATSFPTAMPTAILSPIATPVPGDTLLSVELGLQGIGTAGDSQTNTLYDCTGSNPPSACDGNMNPLDPQRTITAFILNSQNQQIASQQGVVTYNSRTGLFEGTVDLGQGFTSGSYTVKIQTPQYLRGLVSGIQTINTGQTTQLPYLSLIAGDVNGDNQINILDYNTLMECYSDLEPASASCTPTLNALGDLNDDGAVNQDDLNLFLRELSNISGQ